MTGGSSVHDGRGGGQGANADAAAWAARSLEPACHVVARLVARRDRWGGYIVDRQGDVDPVTRPTSVDRARGTTGLTDRIIERHFTGNNGEYVIGVHPIAPGESVTRWGALDYDNHGGDPGVAAANERHAGERAARRAGLRHARAARVPPAARTE